MPGPIGNDDGVDDFEGALGGIARPPGPARGDSQRAMISPVRGRGDPVGVTSRALRAFAPAPLCSCGQAGTSVIMSRCIDHSSWLAPIDRCPQDEYGQPDRAGAYPAQQRQAWTVARSKSQVEHDGEPDKR